MRILLVDNQAKVRFALRLLLEQQPGLVIAGEAGEAQAVLTQVEEIRPELILLDWDLHGLTSALLPALRKVCPDLIVVALSARPEMRSVALVAGADVFASKTDSPECLLEAIQAAILVRHPELLQG